ncbi:MAG: GlsB/YeaQ/YmgE family stress response membrane protein [Acidimicrobiales bacterium]
MGWLSWIVPGLIVGLIARVFVPTGRNWGCLGTILLGIAGSFVGGLIASIMADGEFDLSRTESWIGATVGAIVILVVIRVATPRTPE